MTKTLIRGATIVTMDRSLGILPKGDLLFEGDTISAVGPNIQADDAEIVDGSDMIVIPGLINAHIHMWQTTIRGFGVNWTGIEHHLHMQTDIVPVYTPDDIKIAEYFGALNLLNGGTTTVYEWCHGNRTPEHSDAAIEGLQNSDIRSLFIHGSIKTLPREGEKHFSQIPHPRDEAVRLRKRFGSNDGKVMLALGILGPDYSPLDICTQDFTLATELDLWSSAHVSGKPGKLAGGYFTLKEKGLLTEKHNVVHANSMSDEELKLLIETGCSVTATSQTEVNGGWKEPLIRRVKELGGMPSIGNDSESSSAADMMEVMRWSMVLQRLFNNIEKSKKLDKEPPAATNAVFRGMERPARITPSTYDALEWATMGNAKAFGLDHRIGSLTPGKQADITLIKRTGFNLAPAIDPVDAVVSFANPSNVDTVYVAGKLAKKDGRLVQDAAAQRAAVELRERAISVLERAGMAEFIPA
ncbi:amidohydrolase family protein [Rhizobium sp. 2MFCol3.1]|uniref:amidohydrolase family protein n=1 Tax=Rhizobium sp. 2MFCol3.1 TaxID=1246459 RepID=UPI000376DB17|nr:amidohydrolase family protein [Rhizobium sp. 2MFCol3.1]